MPTSPAAVVSTSASPAATAPSGSSTTAPAPTHPTLSSGQTTLIVLLVVGIIIAVGVLILVARAQERSGSGKHTSVGALISSSVVRSWIAIALVGGLLVLCAAAFAVDDSTVRSTLIGGLTASVGSAIAYYFASKSSEQSTAAIVQATTGMAKIPDLTGKTTDEAIAALGTSFVLGIDPSAASGAHVVSQAPPAGTSAAIGSPVVVKLGG